MVGVSGCQRRVVASASLSARVPGDPGLAEVGGFCLHCSTGAFRVASQDQERCEPHRQFVDAANTIPAEIVFVELAGKGKAVDPNPKDDFWCMFFGHETSLADIG